jgi:hypothetical protein
MTQEPFQFTYRDQPFEAKAECLPAVNGFRHYRLAFPNVQSIVEGSVHVTETPEGEWLIEKFISVHPVPEEFLHAVSQGFVEYIDNQKNQ